MIFFLNRGLILEHEVVKALKKYFSIVGVPEYYRNFTVSITNQHPFARMFLSDSPEKEAMSLFPVVVVATEDDSKPAELVNLVDSADSISIEPKDIEGVQGESYLEKRYDMITPAVIGKLRSAMDAKEDKRIFGVSLFPRRRDRVSIEIWAENPQLKNELYELIRLFVCGFMKEYLAKMYKNYFTELKEDESPLAIFDSSVHGQRSNNFNVDFGIELHGAHITFEADYIIEQTVIDTDIVDAENLILEVINHVKGYDHTARERVIAVGELGEFDTSPFDGDGKPAGSGGSAKQPAEDGSAGEKTTDG